MAKKLVIESVVSLSSSQIEAIKKALKLDNNYQVESSINPGLLGGLRISVNGMIIDQSLKAKINQIRKQ